MTGTVGGRPLWLTTVNSPRSHKPTATARAWPNRRRGASWRRCPGLDLALEHLARHTSWPSPPSSDQPRGHWAAKQMRAAIIEVLRSADHPLRQGELAAAVALPWRSVGYSLFQLVRSGTINRLDGGTYTLPARAYLASELGRSAGPSSAELLLVVAACEAKWRLEDWLHQTHGGRRG